MRPRILALFLCLSGLAMAMPAVSQPLPEDLLLVGEELPAGRAGDELEELFVPIFVIRSHDRLPLR